MNAVAERFEIDSRSAILCGFVALLFVLHAGYLACVTEDAFITFRFASNLVAGHGFVWNVGEAPVEGYTNFLWLLVSATLLATGVDLPFASQVLGVAAGLATLLYVYRCGLLLGWSPRFCIVPCLALACAGPFATWATSGLETSTFALFLTVAVFHQARFVAEGRGRDAALVTSSLLLATLTRPEGLLVAGVIAAVVVTQLSSGRAKDRTRLPATLMGIGVYGLALSIYLLWRWNYFGYPLPNTFYAKTGGGFEQALRGGQYVGLFALHFVLPWGLTLGLAAFNRVRVRYDASARSLLISCGASTGLYSVYIVLVGGDYMAMYRFFVPLLPFLSLLLGAAAARSIRGIDPQSGTATTIKLGVLIGLIGTGFHSTPFESRWVTKPELMHGNYRGVETERWYVSRHERIGRFFARYGRPGESLATGAIGAVAYFSGLTVYDVHGIVDPHIAHEGRSQDTLGTGLPGHEKTDYPYIFEKKPTFYMFSRKLRKEPLAGIPQLVPEVDELVARDYRVGSVFLEDPVNGQSGYFSFLERRDRKPSERARR